jgi:hypothetical protein
MTLREAIDEEEDAKGGAHREGEKRQEPVDDQEPKKPLRPIFASCERYGE